MTNEMEKYEVFEKRVHALVRRMRNNGLMRPDSHYLYVSPDFWDQLVKESNQYWVDKDPANLVNKLEVDAKLQEAMEQGEVVFTGIPTFIDETLPADTCCLVEKELSDE